MLSLALLLNLVGPWLPNWHAIQTPVPTWPCC